MFGLGTSANNIITAVALSELNEQEMAAGFENFAEDILGLIAENIHNLFGIILLAGGLFGQDIPHCIQYLHPKPDSRYISPQSTIILRFDENTTIHPDDVQLKLHGSLSGELEGKLFKTSHTHPFIFKPNTAFSPNEIVTVTLLNESLPGGQYTYQFQVSIIVDQNAIYLDNSELYNVEIDLALSESLQTYGEVTTLNGVTVPSDFPIIEIEGDPENTAPGYIFTAFEGRYIAILHNDGTPYFYQRSDDFRMEFKAHPNGMLSRNVDNRHTNEHFYLTMDSNFNVADTFSAGMGYMTDHHEFQLLQNGHVLIIARDSQTIDMSDIVKGGHSDATVSGQHIQELDENNNVVWMWLSWDHFNVEDAIHENLTGKSIDYCHMNSIAVDYDSQLVISSRNLSEISKINWDTGEFIWRMGGANNEFEFIDTDMNFYQHMVRPVPGHPNHYTVFDNGNHRQPRYTRAVEFRVDTVLMTVEKVWEYRNTPDFRSDWLGSVQRLPNGNTLICWGGHGKPFATEVSPAGDLLYQATVTNITSYRSYRFEWKGISDEPYLIAESDGEEITLIFNKFGDSDVDHYRIYSGSLETQLVLLDTATQTRYDFNDLTAYTDYYFQVTAVNGSGAESLPSNMEYVYIDYLDPQGEIIKNGNFRQGDDHWEFLVSGEAVASSEVEPGRYRIKISNSGNAPEQIQVKQGGISLYQGQTYEFEFDVRGSTARTIQAIIQDNDPPYTNYGNIGYTYILDHRTNHTYTFTMEDATVFDAEVVFNCGAHNSDVYLYHVGLSVTTSVPEHPVISNSIEEFELFQNCPNPFNGTTQIRYNISDPGNVQFHLYNVLGQIIYTENRQNLSAGHHVFNIELFTLSTGLYFYKVRYQPIGQPMRHSEMKKMVYIQ